MYCRKGRDCTLPQHLIEIQSHQTFTIFIIVYFRLFFIPHGNANSAGLSRMIAVCPSRTERLGAPRRLCPKWFACLGIMKKFLQYPGDAQSGYYSHMLPRLDTGGAQHSHGVQLSSALFPKPSLLFISHSINANNVQVST